MDHYQITAPKNEKAKAIFAGIMEMIAKIWRCSRIGKLWQKFAARPKVWLIFNRLKC
jgi:hypothetical protein